MKIPVSLTYCNVFTFCILDAGWKSLCRFYNTITILPGSIVQSFYSRAFLVYYSTFFFFFNQQGFTNISSCVLGRDTTPTETLQIKAEYVAGWATGISTCLMQSEKDSKHLNPGRCWGTSFFALFCLVEDNGTPRGNLRRKSGLG